MNRMKPGQNYLNGVPFYCYHGVVLGDNVTMGPYAVLGKPPKVPSGTTSRRPSLDSKPTVVGDNCVIGACVVVYHGCTLGNSVLLGDGVKLRDDVTIGNNVIVGMNAKIGFKTTIGNRVKIMDLCNISGNMIIEDDVFVAQGTMCANDNSMGRDIDENQTEWEDAGPHIMRAATIGQNSSLLPGIVIGEDAIVGAGSVVTKDVPPGVVVMGVPAKTVRQVKDYEQKL